MQYILELKWVVKRRHFESKIILLFSNTWPVSNFGSFTTRSAVHSYWTTGKTRHQPSHADKLAEPFKPRTAFRRKCVGHCETSTSTPTWKRYHKRCNTLRISLFKASSCLPFDRFLFNSKSIWDTTNHNGVESYEQSTYISNLKLSQKKIRFQSNCSGFQMHNFHHIQIKFIFPVCLRALHFWRGCYSNSWPLDLAWTNVLWSIQLCWLDSHSQFSCLHLL